MAGVRSKPKKGGKFQGWFTEANGKRKYFTGTRSRSETQHMAERLEDEHRQVRLGYRPVPKATDKHKTLDFCSVKEEYLSWGEAQGGLGGRPWAVWHARKRRTHLSFWESCLRIETLGELDGILPRVEKELRKMQTLGRAGKTIANYVEALAAFCDWCVQRGYLEDDPLRGMAPFDTTPKIQRRAMTADEIKRLLAASAPHRRHLYETAFLTGLRAKELRSLTTAHLDVKRGGLHLDAEWTKNRKSGFQPLPVELTKRLQEFAEAGEPGRLYEKNYRRRDAKLKAPKNALLYVPSSLSNTLDNDLMAAGIPKHTPAGKLDFHAIRLAYINLVLESGVTTKEAQALARHSSPDLTFNVYGRVREHRLSEAIERVAEAIEPDEKRATCVPRQAVGAETENATLLKNTELRHQDAGGAEGDRTPDLGLAKPALSQLSYCPDCVLLRRIPRESVRGRCTGRCCGVLIGWLFVIVSEAAFFEAKKNRRGNEQRKESETEDIRADVVVHHCHGIHRIAAETDEIHDNTADLHPFEEWFAFLPSHGSKIEMSSESVKALRFALRFNHREFQSHG